MRDVALITGASGGIGLALARVFAQHGHDLVLVARRGETLKRIARDLADQCHISVTPIPLDLTQPGATEALVRRVRRRKLCVSVLVNNAGVLSTGDFGVTPLAAQLSVLRLNAVVPTELTHMFL